MLVLGDCIPLLRDMPDDSVDVTISDPPYTDHVHKGVKNTWVDGRVAYKSIPFSEVPPATFVPDLLRITRRWVVLFCALEQIGDYLAAAGRAQYIRAGCFRRCQATPQLSGDRPGQAVEGVVILHRKGRKRWNGGGSHAFWEHARDRDERIHPTQKPLHLMLELVTLFSEIGETVFDPFAGSGTTLIAGLRLGRKVHGIEMNPEYHALAMERLDAEARGLTMRDRHSRQAPLFGAGGGE